MFQDLTIKSKGTNIYFYMDMNSSIYIISEQINSDI